MNFMIMRQSEAENESDKFDTPHAIISMVSPGVEDANIADNENRVGLLRVFFYDIDYGSPRMDKATLDFIDHTYGDGLFTEAQAREILDFVDGVKDQVSLLVCHCEAGISRSSGVAAALSLILNGSDKEIFESKQYIPNMFVYRTIVNEWQRRIDNEQ